MLSYVIVDSHCILLKGLPPREKWLKKITDSEALLERARALYQPAKFRRLEQQLAKASHPKRLLAQFQEEFCDLSVFVKRLKETITRSQNLEQNTTTSSSSCRICFRNSHLRGSISSSLITKPPISAA